MLDSRLLKKSQFAHFQAIIVGCTDIFSTFTICLQHTKSHSGVHSNHQVTLLILLLEKKGTRKDPGLFSSIFIFLLQLEEPKSAPKTISESVLVLSLTEYPCVDLSADFQFDKLLACKYFLEEIPVQLLLFTTLSMVNTTECILPGSLL